MTSFLKKLHSPREAFYLDILNKKQILGVGDVNSAAVGWRLRIWD